MDEKNDRPNLINVKLLKPPYKIGQKVFVPKREGALGVHIRDYIVRVGSCKSVEKGLAGVIEGYSMDRAHFIRRGDDNEIAFTLYERDFYRGQKEAEEASKFLEVKVSQEVWDLAIGEEAARESFPEGGEDLSILRYCKKNGGLLIHDRNELKKLFSSGFFFDSDSPIGKILGQLEIESTRRA